MLHVLRYRRDDLDAVIDGDQRHRLRPDLRPAHAASTRRSRAWPTAIAAGNIYVNRNMIGAVVGVQPFGGHGLSGTGPKAGGPLYLRRLLARCPPWSGAVGATLELPGPVGERNVYRLEPRGTVLCIAPDEAALSRQMRAVLATETACWSTPTAPPPASTPCCSRATPKRCAR